MAAAPMPSLRPEPSEKTLKSASSPFSNLMDSFLDTATMVENWGVGRVNWAGGIIVSILDLLVKI